MIVTHTPFKLEVKGGEFDDGQILLVLGDNGTGKSTFIRMLVEYYIQMPFFHRLFL